MRCRKGDLAIVRTSIKEIDGMFVHVVQRAYEGATVTVNGVSHVSFGPDNWLIEFGRPVKGWYRGCEHLNVTEAIVSDRQLIPIRDPGDDARDQTLDWLPVPSREEVRV